LQRVENAEALTAVRGLI